MKIVEFRNVDEIVLGTAHVGEKGELIVEATPGHSVSLESLMNGRDKLRFGDDFYDPVTQGETCLEMLSHMFRGVNFYATSPVER
jgi:glyoxylase-like metal-dependent hydrolase (beta-lactamase superfamily II)